MALLRFKADGVVARGCAALPVGAICFLPARYWLFAIRFAPPRLILSFEFVSDFDIRISNFPSDLCFVPHGLGGRLSIPSFRQKTAKRGSSR
jgi:hypothetical protein